MNQDSEERLGQLVGGYFNEDSFDDYDGWQEATAAFLSDNPRQTIELTLRDLGELLAEQHDDDGWYRRLRRFGSSYDPTGDHGSIPQWLKAVHRSLADYLAGTAPAAGESC